MSGFRGKVLRWHGQRARLGTWRGRDGTAYVTPLPDTPALSAEFVEASLEHLRKWGFRSVVTGALTPGESLGFVDAGFRLHEELRLLEHDLGDIPDATRPTHRAAKGDRPEVLAVDNRCFDEFWVLDDAGLDEAVHATPRSRFRVVKVDGAICGYAVCGRAGPRGYLQRLGVDPSMRGLGIGRDLVADALGWMRGRGVTRALVNTHTGNEAALALYRACGFADLPTPLRILTRAV